MFFLVGSRPSPTITSPSPPLHIHPHHTFIPPAHLHPFLREKMVCGICGLPNHNRSICPTAFCKEILNELVDSTFTQDVRSMPVLHDKQMVTALLLGTHDRTGEQSPLLSLAGQQDILHCILTMAVQKQSVLVPDIRCKTVVEDSWEFSANGGQLIISPYYDACNDIVYVLRNQQTIVGHMVSNVQRRHPSFFLTNALVCKTEVKSFVVDSMHSCFYILNTEDIIKCYNDSNDLIWRAFVEDSVFQDKIVIHNSLLVFCSRFSSTVIGINKHTGNTEWKSTNLGSMMATPPHIFNDMIYLATKNALMVIDPLDGSMVLSVPLKGIQHSNMCITKEDATVIYACDAHREVKMITISYSPTIAFRIDTILTQVSTNIAPIFCAKQNLILVSTMDKFLVAFDNSKRIKRAKWRFHLRSNVVSVPAISHTNDYIYIGCTSGVVFKIELGSGNLIWKFKTRGSIEDPINKSMTNMIVICRRSNGVYMFK